MKTSLDCMACFIRQALDTARMVSKDPAVHERIVRDVMGWAAQMDLNTPPPLLAQRIHRRLRAISGEKDPYRVAKDQCNRMALRMLPELISKVDAAADPFIMATRLAVAGNVIDLGANSSITSSNLRRSVNRALTKPLIGPQENFRYAVAEATRILYLADNAGEIVFDRLLIEQLSSRRVTLAVRGAPVLNDATLTDAKSVGLHEIVKVIENGSDAPGTLLEDCNDGFRQQFEEADLIIAKGQGNFETLSQEPGNIFFLFMVKCSVIAAHVGLPVGTHVLYRSANVVAKLRPGP